MTTGIQTNVTMVSGRTILATLSLSGDARFCQITDTILFASATSFIDSTIAGNVLTFQSVLNRLQAAPPGELMLVVGHTDDVGSPADNDPLSQRRADGVLAVLEARASTWEANYKKERSSAWSDNDFRTMLTAVNGTAPTQTEINQHKELTPAGETRRATLFAAYFRILLSSPSSPPTVNSLAPATLGCGERHPLGSGNHAPSRRAEIFFFRGTSSPTVTCDEYPRWLTPCRVLPPTGFSVTIAPLDTVRVGSSEPVQITVNPSPLPLGSTITLELRTTSGSGEARFASTSTASMEINSTTTVRVQGVTASDALDNIQLTARLSDQSTILAQENFMVVRAVSIFLKFEIWNLTSHAFEPLPAGVDVDVMDADPLGDDQLATSPTDATGQVFFSLDSLNDPDEAEPDLFFRVRTNGRTHAGHTLPGEWSTSGWLATNGTPGLQPDFTGSQLGTPSTPLVFRVGLDIHARLEYHVDAGTRATLDDPAPKGVLVKLMQEQTGPDKEIGAFRTDADGRIEKVVFDAEPGNTFYLNVRFEIEDPDIHLKKARFSKVPLIPPFVDIITPAGGTLEWDSVDADADRKDFPSQRNTSIGTFSTPAIFRCTLADRNVALHILKVLRELGVFLFHMTKGDWDGVEVAVTPTAPDTAFSAPVGRIQLKFPDDRWDRKTVIHEMAHQVMWEEVNFSTLGIAYEGLIPLLGDIKLRHTARMLVNEEQALIEGWAEFIQAIFASASRPPFSVMALVDTDRNPVPGGLGPPPINRGEKIEGALANGLFAIFENHVAQRPTPLNANVPESVNGDVTTTASWITTTTIQDRFVRMIWEPLKALRPLSNPDSTTLLANIKKGNTSDWHLLLPELLAFNMAVAAPTISAVTTAIDSVSPAWGHITGGQTIRITGTDFVGRTNVNNGAGPSVVETTVEVGGRPATNIVVESSTVLTADVPSGAAGPADVLVTTKISGATTATFGSATSSGGFIYIDDPLAVVSVTPDSAPTCRPQAITILGAGFLPLPNTAVFVGAQQIASGSLRVISPTEIRASTPLSSTTGVETLVVQTPGQLDNSRTVEYVAAPCIFNMTPREGPLSGGTVVQITGQNFPASVSVEMSAQSIVPTASSPTTIEFTTPSGLSLGPTTIRVVNPALASHLADEVEFVYTL